MGASDERSFATALAAVLDGRVVERSGTPGGDGDGIYVVTASAGAHGSLRVRGADTIHVVRSDLQPPDHCRWVTAGSQRPHEADVYAADDDEAYVLVTATGAEVVHAPMVPDDAELAARYPRDACAHFLALEAEAGRPLALLIERHVGAYVGPLQVSAQDPVALRRWITRARAVLDPLR